MCIERGNTWLLVAFQRIPDKSGKSVNQEEEAKLRSLSSLALGFKRLKTHKLNVVFQGQLSK